MILNLAKFLRRRGHKVETRSLPLYRKNVDLRNELRGIPYFESWVHHVDADIVYMVYAPIVCNLFLTKAPKIAGIHGFIPASSLSALEAIRLSPSQFFREHGLKFTGAYYYFKFFNTIEMSAFDAIHVVHPSLRYRHRKVYYIPNCIDTSLFKPYKKSDVFTVLFVGRHHWSKGWIEFLKMCQILERKGYNFRFVCTGKGASKVKGFGFVKEEDLSKIYSEAHVTVYPSKIETFGMVLIESLACGTPVVTTPIRAHKNLDLPLTYAYKPEEFAETVIKIYKVWKERTDEYFKLCATCRRQAKKYDVNNVFPKFETMFREIVKET